VGQVRENAAPLVALLSSTFLMCCLVSLPDVVIEWPALETANAGSAGWGGLAVLLALGVAGVSVLLSTRLGSGPALAVGATAGVLGLALARDITSGRQIVLVLVLLGIAVGGLFAAGVCLLTEVPARLSSATLITWVLPWLGGEGVVGWLALHGRSAAETRLGLHPPLPVLTVGALLLLAWAVVTLMHEPPRFAVPVGREWENAWGALAVVVVAVGCIVMLLGFQATLAPSWGRPVILLTAALGAAGLVAAVCVAPDVDVRPAYLALLAAVVTGPACVQALLMVPVAAGETLSTWLVVVLGLGGVLGVVVGWRWPSAAAVVGLVAMTGGAAGGWVMPANPWVMLAAAAPLCLGIAAAATGGLRLASVSRMPLRFASLTAFAGLLLGLVAAASIPWALGAPLTDAHDLRSGGRVLLGLTFALTVVTAGVCAALLDRSRVAPS
jgi:hypothetical protein